MNFTVVHSGPIHRQVSWLGVHHAPHLPIKKQWFLWFAPPLQWWVRSGLAPDSLFSFWL